MMKQYLLASLLLMGVSSCKGKQESSIVFDSTPRVSTMSQAARIAGPASRFFTATAAPMRIATTTARWVAGRER